MVVPGTNLPVDLLLKRVIWKYYIGQEKMAVHWIKVTNKSIKICILI